MTKIDQFRKIVTEGQYGKVEGQRVDLFSASAVIAVYDKLSKENQEKYLSLPPHKMVALAFKLVK